MLCPSCRREIQIGSKFCPECGIRISGISGDSTAEGAQSRGALRAVQGAGPAAAPHTAVVVIAGNPCPACGANNPSEVSFCEGCGASLKRLCPECGREYSQLKRYCGACGTDTTAFLRVQDAVTKMTQYAGEKKVFRVLKEAEPVEVQKFKPRGSKGGALVLKFTELLRQAQGAVRRKETVEKAIRAEWYGAQRPDEAEKLLTEYVALAGGLPEELNAIRQQLLDKRLLLVNKHLETENWPSAIIEAQKILAAAPDRREAKEALSQAQARVKCESEITQALNAWDKGQYAACAAACQQAMEVAGGDFKIVSGQFKELCSELRQRANAKEAWRRRRRIIWSVILCVAFAVAAILIGFKVYNHQTALVAKQTAAEQKRAAVKMVEAEQAARVATEKANAERLVAEQAAAVKKAEEENAARATAEKAWAQAADAAQALIAKLQREAASAKDAAATKLLANADALLARLEQLDTMHLSAASLQKLHNQKSEIGQLKAKIFTGPKPGQALAINLRNGVQLDLVWIPPGEFLMGSPESEKGRGSNEGPQHQVTISRGFWMGKYEITQRQYRHLTGGKAGDSSAEGPDAPVEISQWHFAKAFCKKLQTRLPVEMRLMTARLPTEAEWEYACRSGTTGPYAGELDSMCWYAKNSQKTTHRVGLNSPNAWGLYDMHGNVTEWCWDGKRVYTSNAQTDPEGGGEQRVLRGGHRRDAGNGCRSASRAAAFTDRTYYDDIGFRVVIR